ncbi:FAD dependent oxidoreductase [Microdochium trichocladiopsis]|uniref:FAD dependent oxidoreductase n=1 Tax=Microdochium trichocladiopsis TaxID=1682393 RepID=A0A9P8Y004_9PEZI|nr:FAD dependent oxidoreductase [Microdochium trichocladiopsis]KAH7025170.1 FAD dependent oxidoreductase [Microdochium trichocladiopsis]
MASTASTPGSPDAGPSPVPNSTQPFWRTELHELDNHRSTKDLPAEADIVIIGAGFSGAALAHYIHEDNASPPSVVILEAREACSGATGRNGGHVKPDVYFNVPKYIRKHGVKAAVEVANFEASQLRAVKELVEREKIDCEFTLTRACDVILHEAQAKEAEEAHEQLVKSGVADLRDVQYTSRKHAERVSGVKGALCAWTYTAGHIWPYKLVMHLLQGVVSKGANLQTHTPVAAVSGEPLSDGRWLVTTADRGAIKAKKVLFATNGYTAGLAPQFKDRIVPVRGICGRIIVPSGSPSSQEPAQDGTVTQNTKQAPFLPMTYGLRYGPGLYDYLIPRNDGSIIVGGTKQTWWHEKEHWYNVVDDSTLIEPALKEFEGLMQRRYIGWEDTGACVDRIWTGIMGYTSDSMPYVGHMPGKPGQMVLAGFNGHGMPLILLSAKGLTKMLMEGTTFEETGIPSPFKATQERLDNTGNAILEAVPASKPSAVL